jgi:protoheme IX farnesyltransferase
MIKQHILSFTSNWRDYLELCKPKVVLLILITAVVGMYLSTPGAVPLHIVFYAFVGIGLAASSAAAINHVVDQHADALMGRTQLRPLPSGKVSTPQAIVFAVTIGLLGLAILALFVNTLTAILTFITLMGYAVFYTMFLKRATPQNIVIGGAAGAAPPLLGWTAVTGHFDPNSLLLVLIIFVWTPPHFWALAIHRQADYARAKIPMLPVTHGIAYTKQQILLYTVLLIVVSVLPFIVGMSGLIYLASSLVLGFIFLYYATLMYFSERTDLPMKTFRYSIVYLFALFIALLIDHYWKVML